MDRRTFTTLAAGLVGRLALPAGAVAVAGCSSSNVVTDAPGFAGNTMGTTFQIRLGRELTPEAIAELRTAVQAAVDAVEAQMSTWDAGSELARLNANTDLQWHALGEDTLHVLSHARFASQRTSGAFDATVGPLVNLWGFGPQGRQVQPPSASAIDAMLDRIGWRHVELDPTLGKVRKLRADAQVDLSGIAKGYGVDRVAQVLTARGESNFLVEVGGEIRTRGARPGGAPWRVAIEQPVPGARRVQQLVDLHDRAIATSGDYRNYFEVDERRYSHAIDPRTGRPVTHTLGSVSVVADTALEADAASTALMVMGPEQGPDWAAAHGVAALFLLRDGSSVRTVSTPAMSAHLAG